MVAQYFQTYLFEVIGERMTRRIRTDYFRALLRQDIAWFDDPKNALGVLTSRLAVDVKLIRLTVGQGTGSTVSSMTALLAGLIIGLVAAWQFSLAFLATMPLLALSEAVNWALMSGGDSSSKKVSDVRCAHCIFNLALTPHVNFRNWERLAVYLVNTSMGKYSMRDEPFRLWICHLTQFFFICWPSEFLLTAASARCNHSALNLLSPRKYRCSCRSRSSSSPRKPPSSAVCLRAPYN